MRRLWLWRLVGRWLDVLCGSPVRCGLCDERRQRRGRGYACTTVDCPYNPDFREAAVVLPLKKKEAEHGVSG